MNLLDRLHIELKNTVDKISPIRLPEDLHVARKIKPNPRQHIDKVEVTEEYILGDDGYSIFTRIYSPKATVDKDLPVLLWIHGGGYVMGHPDYDDELCEQFVLEASCIVVAPSYRLAPENPFPAGLEDCYATLMWIANEAHRFGGNSSKIAIAGGSAGGGMTAALALLNRDRKGIELCLQMPLYPMIDYSNVTASSHEATDDRLWSRRNNIEAWNMYLNGLPDISQLSYASPLHALSFEGLPPTYTCVGELDPFRDETIQYVSKLSEAGIPVEFHLYPGCFHSFERAEPNATISIEARQSYVKAVANAFYSNLNK